MAESSERGLAPDEVTYIDAAREAAFVYYEGVKTPHRSCGIALAETFGLPTPAYQSLRRGGITGEGACGAIRAGEQVLGEILGDPSPTGAVTAELRAAVTWYQNAWKNRLVQIRTSKDDIRCNTLVASKGDFLGAERKAFCTSIAADVAALTAEALCRFAPPATRPVIRPAP
jgi:hypothetical protein